MLLYRLNFFLRVLQKLRAVSTEAGLDEIGGCK